MKFEHTEVYGFHHAIRGMRNPLESWGKSDSLVGDYNNPGYFEMGKADLKLAYNLSLSGNDHAKYLRQIQVWADITAPEYWWKEYSTYTVGNVQNSTSQMHKLGSRLLTKEDFAFGSLDLVQEVVLLDIVNSLIKEWWATGKKKPSFEWRSVIQAIPQSFLYTRTVNVNYQTLKNMYHARKNHRLSEWHEFAKWVEELPYSELITLK